MRSRPQQPQKSCLITIRHCISNVLFIRYHFVLLLSYNVFHTQCKYSFITFLNMHTNNGSQYFLFTLVCLPLLKSSLNPTQNVWTSLDPASRLLVVELFFIPPSLTPSRLGLWPLSVLWCLGPWRPCSFSTHRSTLSLTDLLLPSLVMHPM